MKNFTRKDYMENRLTHAEYYGLIAKEAGISYANSQELPRIKEAISTDENLNNIPLSWWDKRANSTVSSVSKALKNHGDFYSLAGGVCVHKAAAIKAAKS
jgi:hypothetical protein